MLKLLKKLFGGSFAKKPQEQSAAARRIQELRDMDYSNPQMKGAAFELAPNKRRYLAEVRARYGINIESTVTNMLLKEADEYVLPGHPPRKIDDETMAELRELAKEYDVDLK